MTPGRSEGFPPAVRLRKRREYQTTYQRGVRVPGSLLVLFLLESDHGFARLGITATRKVGCAVVRNRARRCIREVFRRHNSSMPSWDVVINIRAKAVNATYQQLETELLSLVARGVRRIARIKGRGGS